MIVPRQSSARPRGVRGRLPWEVRLRSPELPRPPAASHLRPLVCVLEATATRATDSTRHRPEWIVHPSWQASLPAGCQNCARRVVVLILEVGHSRLSHIER